MRHEIKFENISFCKKFDLKIWYNELDTASDGEDFYGEDESDSKASQDIELPSIYKNENETNMDFVIISDLLIYCLQTK